MVCDGVDAVRGATRELLHRGARHIKVMLGGGIASPADGMEDVQYSRAELEAVVDEASRAGRYVTGHAYTPAAIRHGLEAGLRSLEICRREGVAMLFGTDLLGELRVAQGREFRLRAEVLPLAEVSRSATAEAARRLGLPPGCATVRPGAPADLILVRGDPLANPGVLADGAANVVAVFTAGRIAHQQANVACRRQPPSEGR